MSNPQQPAQNAAAQSTSPWAPLFNAVFRRLWLVWLIANTCMWMNDVAAAWLMISLTPSPVMVALVQSASTLPVFLLGLPSGALADIFDRRRFFIITQFWVAGSATLLCLAIASGIINPTLLLVFANGIGLALRWPVYSALVPELVPRSQLPSALAMNGVAMNTSRIIGPVVAGALIASAGTAWVFVLNALLSVVAGFVIITWKRERKATSSLPGERFLGAMRVGLQYVRKSPPMRVALMRIFLFFVQSTGLLALLPLVAKQMPGGSAGTYTVLLASMGAGAVVSAMLIPRWRHKYPSDRIVQVGSTVQALLMVVVVFSPNLWLAVPAMIVSGIAWLTVANTISVSAQLSLPDWVRARAMATFQMGIMGGTALGAALWGQVTSLSNLQTGITMAAITGVALLWLTHKLRLDTIGEDMTPSRQLRPPVPGWELDPRDGPVLTTIEYRIDPSRIDEFRMVMQETGRRRLSRGALSWELFRDTRDPGRFIEYMIDESWLEHVRHFDRLAYSDELLRDRRLSMHIGDGPPVVTRSIADSGGRG